MGVAIGRHTLLSATVLAALVLWKAFPDERLTALLVLGGTLVLTIAAYMLGSLVVDVSWDGLAYHLPGAIYLSQGWNPFRSDADVAWLNAYPLGQYIVSAAYSLLTGASVDGVKSFHAVYALAAFAEALLVLIEQRSLSLRTFVLGGLLVASPTALSQLCNSYVDGDIGSLLLCLGLALTLYRLTRAGQWLLTAAAAVVVLSGLKFTGLIYAAMLCVLIGGFYFYQARAWAGWKERLVLPMSMGAALAFAVLVTGFHPYITNVLRHGTPFYPSRAEILRTNIPDFYRNIGAPRAFLASLFSRTSDATTGDVQWKWPIAVDNEEVVAAGGYDTRSGGFGPLFALQLLLTLSMLAGFRRRLDRDWGVMGFALMLTVAPFPDPWWARYIPQFYTALIALLLGLHVRPDQQAGAEESRARSLVFSAGAAAAIVATIANVAIVTYSHLYYRCYAGNVKAAEQLSDLKHRHATVWVQHAPEIPDNAGMSTTLTDRLTREGVPLDAVQQPGCRMTRYVYPAASYCERATQ